MKSERRFLQSGAVFTCLGLLCSMGVVAQQQTDEEPRWKRSPERWLDAKPREGSRAPTVSGYLEEIANNPPAEEGILFAGSASIWMWDTEKWFLEYATINRGFGGSMISESTYFAYRMIIPHKPKVIVMYSGENDVTNGKPLNVIAEHFQEFVNTIRGSLPNTPIIYVSIRPSNRNWDWSPKFRKTNKLIEAVTKKDPMLYYVDVDTPMIGANGKPRPELYQEDDWHPSEECYDLWTSLVMPKLEKAIKQYEAATAKK